MTRSVDPVGLEIKAAIALLSAAITQGRHTWYFEGIACVGCKVEAKGSRYIQRF
jgi:hypothetical protein